MRNCIPRYTTFASDTSRHCTHQYRYVDVEWRSELCEMAISQFRIKDPLLHKYIHYVQREEYDYYHSAKENCMEE